MLNKLLQVTEKDKFVNYGIFPSMLIQSIAESSGLLQSDLNG